MLISMGFVLSSWRVYDDRFDGMDDACWAKECGGETFGDAIVDVGADRMPPFTGGGISICACWENWFGPSCKPAMVAAAATCWALLLRLELGLLCIRECLVSSSDRLNRLLQPGNWHACGFSPVCVRICRV